MNLLIEHVVNAITIGIGATVVMDVWLTALKRLNIPTLNFALLGRWVGHLAKGRWFHDGIGKSDPICHELMIGWAAHYFIGACFGILLLISAGSVWFENPRFLPALSLGIFTVAAPLLLMQPAMGAGIASRKTHAPIKNSLKSLLNHSIFGCGLYFSGWLLSVTR